MEDLDDIKGYLLAAHPKRQDVSTRRGVILIVDHDHTGSVGLQINKPMESHTTLLSVMQGLGMTLNKDKPLWFGGPESTNRIIVVHTLDWSSTSTTKVTENIGISNDISVLTAISKNEGPSKFRAIAGYVRWMPSHLEGELESLPPFNDISTGWSLIPATEDLVFEKEGIDQWHNVLEQSAKNQIESWF